MLEQVAGRYGPAESSSHRGWSLITATIDRRPQLVRYHGEYTGAHGFVSDDV